MPNLEVLGEKFITPEGSSYLLFSKEYIGNFTDDLIFFKDILITGQKLRILYDKPSFKEKILDSLLILSSNYGFKLTSENYATNFFEVKTNSLPKIISTISETDWKNYELAFTLSLVSSSNLQEIEIFKDFMLNSFGNDLVVEDQQKKLVANTVKQKKISTGFLSLLQDQKIKNYIIYNTEKTPVAVFCLVDLLHEIQLQSVGGRSSFKTEVKIEKLPLIMSAVYNLMQISFPQKNLSLTCSKPKLAYLYVELGCSKFFERQGLVVIGRD